MVFLDVLVNYGCRRWLHKEDYSFEGVGGAKNDKSRERERERAERYWALRFAELRPDARREKERNRKRLIDRRTDHCLLNVLTSSFFLCVSQRG